MPDALVDSHVHLDDPRFSDDIGEVIARARGAGVGMQVVPGVDRASWPRIRAICAAHEGLFPAYGLHPMFLAQHAVEHLEELSAWLDGNPAVAVGEIGLDFHVEGFDRALQQHYFQRQLELALERELPVIVHARKAVEEVIQSLRKMPGIRGVLHSFAGSEQQARQLWQLGFHIGIGGPVTYERAQRLRRIVAGMPIDHLLLETDAPDQPDAAHRGRRNEPARLVEIVRCVSILRGETEETIAAATAANSRRLFGLECRAEWRFPSNGSDPGR